MVDVRVVLSGSWVALMLTYLLGDVLRIFSGDFQAGKIGGMQVSQAMYVGLAILLMIPVVMVFLSLTLKYPAIRWVTIAAALILFGFNLLGLPTYPSAYDKLLIVVGLVFNVLIIRYAWKWSVREERRPDDTGDTSTDRRNDTPREGHHHEV